MYILQRIVKCNKCFNTSGFVSSPDDWMSYSPTVGTELTIGVGEEDGSV